MRRMFFILGVLLSVSSLPLSALANTSFEVAGWIPYWRAATGTSDTIPHLQNLTSVMPFGYIVQNDGTLHDAFGLNAPAATSSAALLVTLAKAEGVRVVPTVMWSNPNAIQTILSDSTSRVALEDAIVALVQQHNFSGIDIDFENRPIATRPYFSLFLKGLYQRMGNKWVYCSIEARTPPASQFEVIPPKLNYATDLTAINSYCDRVQIMTYDQGTIDLKLNKAANQAPYIPVSDPRWVEKAVNLMAQTVSKKKILIGIPTYGYEYDLTSLNQGYRYDFDWAFNPRYATSLASALHITPTRNMAGELSFVYTPTSTPVLASAGPTPVAPLFRIAWWSDAQAVADKVALAKKLGVRGVAIFKLDGGEDPNIWNVLPKKQ